MYMYIPSPCLARRKGKIFSILNAFKILYYTISLHSLLRFAGGARSWKPEARSTCPTPTKEKNRANGKRERFGGTEGKGPMYLHDPRRSYSTPFARGANLHGSPSGCVCHHTEWD